MPQPLALNVVIYVKDVASMTRFYETVFALERIEADSNFVTLGSAAFELTIMAMPPALAAAEVITRPPRPRAQTPIKVSIRVAGIEASRAAIEAAGGSLKPAAAAWSWRGQRHLDGVDVEGNVFQLREAEASIPQPLAG